MCLDFIGMNEVAIGQNHMEVIPQPVEVKSLDGTFQLTAQTKIVVPSCLKSKVGLAFRMEKIDDSDSTFLNEPLIV